nr:pseudouridine synthase family protein [Tanacetum cinerariifolium]
KFVDERKAGLLKDKGLPLESNVVVDGRTDKGVNGFQQVAESPLLEDKMRYVFGHSRGEDESMARLMRDLCLLLRVSLSNKRRYVAELEAVGEVKGVVKYLEHMRVIVACDVVTLGELETLLGRAQVGVSLKAAFVADMETKD